MTPIDWNENDRVVLQRRIEKLEREIREAADGRGARWRRRIEARLDAIVATFEPPLSDARDRIAALEQAHAETRDKCTDRFIQNRNRLYALERSVAPEETYAIHLSEGAEGEDRHNDHAACCTCGIRPQAAGPNHGAGCPAEVSGETIALLCGMLARAERERDVAQENYEAMSGISQGLSDRLKTTETLLYAARADARRLRELIKVVARYAEHDDGCTYRIASNGETYDCICGLRVALDGAAT